MSRPKKTRLDQLQGEKNKSVNATRILAATVNLLELKDGDRKLVKLTVQSGQAFTLPFATGKGSCYRLFLEKSITSNTNTIVVQSGNNAKTGAQDAIMGYAGIGLAAGTGALQFSTSTAHTITLNGTTQGGLAGSYIELEDADVGIWRVAADLNGSGTIVTPFS